MSCWLFLYCVVCTLAIKHTGAGFAVQSQSTLAISHRGGLFLCSGSLSHALLLFTPPPLILQNTLLVQSLPLWASRKLQVANLRCHAYRQRRSLLHTSVTKAIHSPSTHNVSQYQSDAHAASSLQGGMIISMVVSCACTTSLARRTAESVGNR